MAILTPGLAKAYYDRILEIHFNRGSQTIELKVVEYQDLMDIIMANIQGIDRKTGKQIKGSEFVKSEVRSMGKPEGTVSPILYAGIQLIKAFRNEIVHEKIRIDYDDYRMCVKYMAKTIAFFSQVPILNEIIDVYSVYSIGNPYNPSQNAPLTPGSNSPEKTPAPSQNASPVPGGNKPKPATPSTPSQDASPVPGGSKPKPATPSTPSQNTPPKPRSNKPKPAEAIPEGLRYAKSSTGVTITGYTGNATTLVIPSFIGSNEVTEIAPEAFKGNNILQRIKLPETLETIGISAFYSCTALRQIDFPENLKTIGYGAFWGCTALQQIGFPENLKTIGQYAFAKCGLRTVSLPKKLESIVDYVFHGCDNLTSISLSRQTKRTGSFPPKAKLIYLD